MANEEKSLEMLENIQADMRTMKSDIAALKGEQIQENKAETEQQRMDEWEAWKQLSHILTKEEGDDLARVMDEIERRKAAMYA